MYPYSNYLAALQAQNTLKRSRLQAQLAANRNATVEAIRRSRLQAEILRQRNVREEIIRRESLEHQIIADRSRKKDSPYKRKLDTSLTPIKKMQGIKNRLDNHIKVETNLRQQDLKKTYESQNAELKKTVQKLQYNLQASSKDIQSLKVTLDIVMTEIKNLKPNFNDSFNSLQQRIQSNQKTINQQSSKIEHLIKLNQTLQEKVNSQEEKINQNELLISKLKTQLTQIQKNIGQNYISKPSLNFHQKLQIQEKELNKIKIKIENFNQKQTFNKTRIQQHQKLIQKHSEQFSKLSLQIEKNDIKQLTDINQYSQQNVPQSSFRWSETLKSSFVKIDGSLAVVPQESGFFQFALLQAGFSSQVKTTQSWSFKINKDTDAINLGISLKNVWQKHKFSDQHVDLMQIGHGRYTVDCFGYCSSHSDKEFNLAEKSFKFGKDDVVQVEYDPNACKIRFVKMRGGEEYGRFEMPIVLPPEGDAYHPCVGFYYQNDPVELILPIKTLELPTREKINYGQMPLDLKIDQIFWSSELKSQNIKVDGKISQKLHYYCQFEFSLLQIGFSASVKDKQCWAIKINNLKDSIVLGVCLKEVWKNNDFCSKNMGLVQHGANMISNTGLCMSHYSQELNIKMLSFEFTKGDIIYVDYDPSQGKLRFRRNLGPLYFELPLDLPPQNDSYHPCVGFLDPQDSAQLVLPGIIFDKSQVSNNLIKDRYSTIDSFRWGIKSKKTSIKINGNIITNSSSKGDFSFALMQAAFQSNLNNTKRWIIRMNQVNLDLLGVGICLKKWVQKNDFIVENIPQQQLDHGIYMICNNGMCLNSMSLDFNMKEKSFKFQKGDIIYIEYNPAERMLKFKNKKSNDFFQMPISLPPQDDAFHPCVGIMRYNDSVQLFLREQENSQKFQQQLTECDLNTLNNSIESIKWVDPFFKSNLKINGYQISNTHQSQLGKFAMLSFGFSSDIKSKQNWAIKASYFTNRFMLGICLKNKMIEYDYIPQNFNQNQTGHGLYMINSKGIIFSHSSIELNLTSASFSFDQEDVIFVEYDPIKWILRFRKNKTIQKFEMPITPPPKGDAYHPFIFFGQQKNSAQLILPGQDLQQANQKKQTQLPQSRFYLIPLGMDKDSIKWSNQLKGQHIKIEGSSIILTQNVKKFNKKNSQFSLLEVGFSSNIKSKQCWAIKINQIQGCIRIGLCSKEILTKSDFQGQNIQWYETGHGLYVIDYENNCYSHSSQRYNNVKKGISFYNKGDIMYVQYDPSGGKLRFRLNQGEYSHERFEMPIILPSLGDTYHPCVSFCEQNDSVQLILPGKKLL